MYQVVQQTREEKIKMYMKCSKKELAEMLVECNRLLDLLALPKVMHTEVEGVWTANGYNSCVTTTQITMDESVRLTTNKF